MRACMSADEPAWGSVRSEPGLASVELDYNLRFATVMMVGVAHWLSTAEATNDSGWSLTRHDSAGARRFEDLVASLYGGRLALPTTTWIVYEFKIIVPASCFLNLAYYRCSSVAGV